MRWKYDSAISFIAHYAAARGLQSYLIAIPLTGYVIFRRRDAVIQVKDTTHVKSSFVQHNLNKIEEIAQR